ncbi:DNA cytosine methyltransferase [Streptococcus suis]|uniref:Cytosine-specific methyltransferase n=1 Tax=Streptococcus suis TaxID=1307 RepID=A0A0Z8GQZ3_STRSU|nr:DNA cytosine methyltransferase [Streptococcus suis]MCK3976834.1 DNA cytosine methyltransferase [Streptococcus suis]MCK4005475.1 DNA cytosine methyltransferase [Streptococcus suis]MCR1232614.1 DNA cytosine methyltransferase [Streptococcus suis]MDG4504358.1 DNA cytosine methyltransferase [Streptococcus suis]MDW8575972.1 DNA cytosine methyltransferase [Streptococcus suis]
MKVRKPRVISLFSGAGGMDLGFEKAGFEIAYANDIMPEAVNTYNKNFSHQSVLADITTVKSEELPDDIDIVIGGFPCQGFSIANKNRNTEDKRNFLYLEMLRIIKDKKPKFFLAENVKGILSLGKGKVIQMIIKDFESIGYKVDYKLVNAAEYGVPQARERVLIMGNRIGAENKFPETTHSLTGENLLMPQAITTETAIGWLSDVPLKPTDQKVDGKLVKNHIASENVKDKFWGRKYDVNQHEICDYLKYWRDKAGWSTKKIDDHFGYKYTAGHWFRKDNNSGSIPKPSDWWELKKILGFDDKYDKQVTTFVEKPIKFEQSLRITNWDRPSDTITGTGPEIHVNKERRLSVRETAILQSFPLEFEFTGSLNKMYLQVGNAVPPLLAQRVAESIKLNMENSSDADKC